MRRNRPHLLTRHRNRELDRFVRLQRRHPDRVVVRASNAVSLSSGPEHLRPRVCYRWGYTVQPGKERNWFYYESRLSYHGFADYESVVLFVDEASAERHWREALGKVLTRKPVVYALDEGSSIAFGLRDDGQVAGISEANKQRNLKDLTAIYSTLTGLPADAAQAYLLGGIPHQDVYAVTGGDPTPEQVQSYLFLGTLRAPLGA